MNNSIELLEDNPRDNFLDLPPPLRAPSRTHGRAMVALVYDAGVCSEAIKVLARRAEAQRDSEGMRAIRILSDSFNQTSTALCKAQGWTEEMLAMCDRDISISFASAVTTAESRKIILGN